MVSVGSKFQPIRSSSQQHWRRAMRILYPGRMTMCRINRHESLKPIRLRIVIYFHCKTGLVAAIRPRCPKGGSGWLISSNCGRCKPGCLVRRSLKNA